MQPYANRGGDSGIAAYEFGPDFIRVMYKTGATYVYSDASCGQTACETMRTLAESGHGLNSFINRYVKQRYAHREK